jgi:hypothetical protein
MSDVAASDVRAAKPATMTMSDSPAFGRRRGWVVSAATAAALAVIGAAFVASVVLDRPLSDFTREPQLALGGHFYVGFVAVTAVLGWWVAAVVALFTAATAVSERLEFLVFGLVTAFLVLDDAFQVHEIVLPNVIGIPQPVVYTLYGLAFGGLMVIGRHFIARYDAQLFVAAVALLAASVLVDVVEHVTPYHSRVAEEGTKLLGIALLAVFTWGAASARIRRDREVSASQAEAPPPAGELRPLG